MASFESANLDHELADKFVLFKLGTKLRFLPEELGSTWLLQFEFWEKDPLKDDPIPLVPKSVSFGEVDANKIRYYFQPPQEEFELSQQVEIASHLVNTEPGKEEVYSKLELKPVGEGSTFTSAETNTNVTQVDV
ncbi:MAG: hypothetical protein PVJ43_11035 [Gemmatimonadales bacterium]|jgi:hypothetical protein